MLAMISDKGWTPGIGDPTVVGWLTVAVYFITAVCSFKLARNQLLPGGYVKNMPDLVFWTVAALCLFVLGINKQLDLQTWFTELGRDFFKNQGWYEKRRSFQLFFIIGLAVIGVVTSIFLYMLTRRTLRKNWIPLCGGLFLILFVIARAFSFHHLDEMLGKKVGFLKINWIMELSGLFLILSGAISQLLRRPHEKPFPVSVSAAGQAR